MSSIAKFISSLLIIACISCIHAQENASHSIGSDLYESFIGAIEMDSFLEIKQFVEFGVDINHRYNNDKTPLMLATIMGSGRSLSVLLELGADVDIKSAEGKTALDYAEINGDKFIISMLKANPGQDHTLIKEIQFYLNKLGYKAGPIDGLLGDKTTNALKRFTERTRQKRPAEISYRQVEALKKLYFGEVN